MLWLVLTGASILCAGEWSIIQLKKSYEVTSPCQMKYYQPVATDRLILYLELRPEFDSPSIFCRLLDKDKGGYFSISPPDSLSCTTKQQYLPSSCILQTRYIHEDGVVDLVDFFPRPKDAHVMTKANTQSSYREATKVQEELKRWLVRRVECIRGSLTLGE